MAKKQKIKVTEIKNNVKIISDENSKSQESPLENNVETSGQDFVSTSSSTPIVTPIIRPEETIQELPRQVQPTQTLNEDQRAFSEGVRYTANPSLIQGEGRRQYQSAEDAQRRVNPGITSSMSVAPVNFNPLQRNEQFKSDELASLRGEATRNYDEPLDLRTEKPQRKLPWEL